MRRSRYCTLCAHDRKTVYLQPDTAKITSNKAKFLAEFATNGGYIQRACNAVGVSYTTFCSWRDRDAEFALAVDTIREIQVERLEAEVDRRAMGYEEALSYQGRLTGDTVTRYSDNLLMFRLKALKPETYRDGPGIKSPLSDVELDEALSKMINKRMKQLGSKAVHTESESIN